MTAFAVDKFPYKWDNIYSEAPFFGAFRTYEIITVNCTYLCAGSRERVYIYE